jgi:hypothetical protein
MWKFQVPGGGHSSDRERLLVTGTHVFEKEIASATRGGFKSKQLHVRHGNVRSLDHPPRIYIVHELSCQGIFEIQMIHPEDNVDM